MKFKTKDLENLLDACHEIVGDFYRYGVILQADESNEYGKASGIGKLIEAINKIEGGSYKLDD